MNLHPEVLDYQYGYIPGEEMKGKKGKTPCRGMKSDFATVRKEKQRLWTGKEQSRMSDGRSRCSLSVSDRDS